MPQDRLVLLLELHERRISNYLRSSLGNDATVEVCMQETFMSAYELIREGRAVNITWLYTVARSRTTDVLCDRGRVRTNAELPEGHRRD
jgi:DNA-directed RNA polymerase specialized sigma24 family protein